MVNINTANKVDEIINYEEKTYSELKQMERENREKRELLLGISHNMRTPLNAIMGLVAIMEKDVYDTDKVKENISKLKSSCRYLLSMVNDVLDMNSVECQLILVNNSEFELNNFLADVDVVMEQLAADKKVKYIVKKENIVHNRLIGDKSRLYQILLNILSNAVKYTPENGEIKFSIQQSIEGKCSVVKFKIADTGIGMSKVFMERIFEPYAREIDRIPNDIIGNGLGLSIVKKLVDLMEGKMEVSSTPGMGTVFNIEMTFDIVEETKECNPNPEQSEVGKELEGLRFMIVEDNKVNGDIVESFLEYEGAFSVVCVNGQEAYDTFMNEPSGTFDMIFMDTRMPIMNGYETVMAIRNSNKEDAKTIPIISMTADAFGEDAIKAKNAGMNGYVSKPIDFEILKAIIIKNLK